jgi:hypothetical protein
MPWIFIKKYSFYAGQQLPPKKLPAPVKNSNFSNSPSLNIELMKQNNIFSEAFSPIVS